MAVTEKDITKLIEKFSTKSLSDTHYQWTQDTIEPFPSFSIAASDTVGETLHSTYGTVPNVTVGSGVTSTTGTATGIWTTTSPGTSIGVGSPGMWTTSPIYTTGTGGGGTLQSGKVHIQGENADLVIGDKSMKAWMEKVEERLNILTPNPELEKEWDDLRKLGERYRKLEKKCQEKALVWKKLKSMPVPRPE
jgi:hypothetical protein